MFFLLILVASCSRVQALDHSLCSDNATRCLSINGRLSAEHLDHLETRIDEIETIVVNSKGGPVGVAAKIARLIMENELNLVVEGYCSSACAEYLMTAAKSVYAVNAPVIGVHGNPIIDEMVYRSQSDRPITHCEWPARSTLSYIYAQNGLSDRFHEEQISRLRISKLFFDRTPDGCIYKLDLRMGIRQWLPTSEQLSDLLGVDIIGEVCADKAACISREFKKKGRLCIWGNEEIPC